VSWLTVDWAGYLPVLLDGLIKSVQLTVIGFTGACLVGSFVALLRTSRNRVLSGAGYLYTELFKNLPMITGIFIIYFGLTGIGVVLDAFTAGWLALALFYGAYLAEIFRGGLQGVSRGQTEAAHALGLSTARVLMTVQLPQAGRLALPATATMLVDLLKGTALLVTIGGGELMTQATIITSETFRPLEVYIVIGLLYVAMSWPLARLVGHFESRMRDGAALAPMSRKLRRITRERLAKAAVSTGGEAVR